MPKYRISVAERWAVFLTHDQRCYLCRRPLDFRSACVDHIIPEALAAQPEALNAVLKGYGLPSDFDLNSFENWLPACGPCNGEKSANTFEPTPIIQRQVERARLKARDAKSLMDETVSRPRAERALRQVLAGYQSGILGRDDLADLFEAIATREGDGTISYLVTGPIWLTPRLELVQELGSEMVLAKARNGRIGLSTKAPNPDWSWLCSNCGELGPWDGNRCLTCGRMNDPGD